MLWQHLLQYFRLPEYSNWNRQSRRNFKWPPSPNTNFLSFQNSRLRSKTDIAITSMSVSRHDGSTAVVGTEAGVIFQTSLNTIAEFEPDRLDSAGITADDGKWFDPVKSSFSGHTGRVLDVKVFQGHNLQQWFPALFNAISRLVNFSLFLQYYKRFTVIVNLRLYLESY